MRATESSRVSFTRPGRPKRGNCSSIAMDCSSRATVLLAMTGSSAPEYSKMWSRSACASSVRLILNAEPLPDLLNGDARLRPFLGQSQGIFYFCARPGIIFRSPSLVAGWRGGVFWQLLVSFDLAHKCNLARRSELAKLFRLAFIFGFSQRPSPVLVKHRQAASQDALSQGERPCFSKTQYRTR